MTELAEERSFHDQHYARVRYPETLDEFLAQHRPLFSQPYWKRPSGGPVWADATQRMLAVTRPDGDWRGIRVIDVGSGFGYLGLWLAWKGADVTGVELSPVGVRLGQEAAKRYGLFETCRFIAASADSLPLPGEHFDVAVSSGVLHHLVKYPESSPEVARVLKPGARWVAQESWWENPVLNALRRRFTMYGEDAGDTELTWQTLRAWGGRDFQIDVEHLSLLFAAKRFLRPTSRVRRALLAAASASDRVLCRVPGLRRMGAEAVVTLTKRR